MIKNINITMKKNIYGRKYNNIFKFDIISNWNNIFN